MQKKLQVEGADPVAIAKEAGFNISIAELMRYQAQIVGELSDEELENAAGGTLPPTVTAMTSILGISVIYALK